MRFLAPTAQTGDDGDLKTADWSPFPTTIQNQDLVWHQDGFGNNRTEPARPTKPDNDGDGMQKKTKDVAHSQDGTKREKFKNSRRFPNSPPTGSREIVVATLGDQKKQERDDIHPTQHPVAFSVG